MDSVAVIWYHLQSHVHGQKRQQIDSPSLLLFITLKESHGVVQD